MMANNFDAARWQKISVSLEVLANINYVLKHIADKNLAGREHLHDLMSQEIDKLIAICKPQLENKTDLTPDGVTDHEKKTT
jgi:hypothetical protein